MGLSSCKPPLTGAFHLSGHKQTENMWPSENQVTIYTYSKTNERSDAEGNNSLSTEFE